MAPKSKQPRQQTQLINKPASELVIDQVQSLELVKTVMTATISTIAWCREIFPDDRFVLRVYDCADPSTSYHSFMQGNSEFSFERSDNILNWRVLAHGLDPAANKLLDWLELGVTDALTRKYLSKLQLSFHTLDGTDADDSNLIEAHILTVTYEDGVATVGAETTAGKSYSANSIVLHSAKQELQGVIKNVALLTQDLDPLPAQRRMNMKLMYNESCPAGYEPQGFRTCTDQGSSILISGRGARVGGMKTGFHSVSVKVIQQTAESASDSPDECIREDFSANRPSTMNTMNSTAGTKTPAIRSLSAQASSTREIQRRQTSSSEICGSGTQQEAVKLFKSMGTSRVPNSNTQDTVMLSVSSQLSTLAVPRITASPDMAQNYLLYSQAVLRRINGRKQLADHALADPQTLPLLKRRFSCECKSTNEDFSVNPAPMKSSGTLQCSICDAFQHAPCYGYLNEPATSQHVCYTCLLEAERQLLSEIEELCVRRRVLYYMIEQGGLKAIKPLSILLARDDAATLKILEHLRREGFVKAALGARRGKTKNGKPIFELSCGIDEVKTEYFSPDLKIQHHLAIPEDTFAVSLGDDGLNAEHSELLAKPMTNTSNGQSIYSGEKHRGVYQRTPLEFGSSTEGTLTPEPDARGTPPLGEQALSISGRSSPALLSPLLSKLSKDSVSEASSSLGLHPQEASEPEQPSDLVAGLPLQTTKLDAPQKRVQESTDSMKLRKRAKVSSVNSPWVLRKNNR